MSPVSCLDLEASMINAEVRSASLAAWDRISELIEGIKRQYAKPKGDTESCKKWAREIILQCEIIQRMGEEA